MMIVPLQSHRGGIEKWQHRTRTIKNQEDAQRLILLSAWAATWWRARRKTSCCMYQLPAGLDCSTKQWVNPCAGSSSVCTAPINTNHNKRTSGPSVLTEQGFLAQGVTARTGATFNKLNWDILVVLLSYDFVSLNDEKEERVTSVMS